jgi:hypothetical protein
MAVFATGADERYGYALLNLLGSVAANGPRFERIVAYDLGLSPFQRRLLDAVRGVEVRTVPPFAQHWAACFTWKPWIWTNLEADEIVWLDAGTTVLRPLEPLLEEVRENGYFLVSQGHPLEWLVPTDYYELYGLPREAAREQAVAAGIIGFRVGSDFYDRVIVPTYEDCLRGRNLGFSPSESERLNYGLTRLDDPPLRDCSHFRWDQSVLNIRLRLALAQPRIADLDRFAGYRSAHDHPEQVIWSHRRRGDLRYLPRVPYRLPLAPLGRAFGLWLRWRRWGSAHSWLLRPELYARKVLRTASGGVRGRG